MQKIFYFLIICLFFSPKFGNCQTKKIDKALTYYESGEYGKSRDMLTKIYPKCKDKVSKGKVSYYLGMCSRNLSDCRNAERWFKRAVQAKYSNPLATLYLADAQKMKGNYEDASITYSNYMDLVPSDPLGQKGVDDCNLALQWMEKPTRYKVYPAKFLNDKEADFSPAFGRDSTEIYFSSSRESALGSTRNENSGANNADIFYAVKDKKGKWSIPVGISDQINTSFDEGSPYLTRDGKTIYYTSCQNVKNQKFGCRIYFSTLSQDNLWSKPEMVELFKDSSISVGHPCLSADEKILYFSSDAKGGLGGKDIWFVEKTGRNQWSEPKNMGLKVNTPGNEMYPYSALDGSFYFSSDGKGGMGGLDIFKMYQKDGQTLVENMQYPINSQGDDFGICFFKNNPKGYFSTNRDGRGDDIYAFYLPPIMVDIVGVVKREDTGVLLPDSKVTMTASDGTQLETTTDNAGVFKFTLSENLDYMFVANRNHFLKGISKETTKGLTDNTTLKTEIYLTPINSVVEVENIEYDFNKATLRQESKVSLDDLVELLQINYNIVIELRANTDFRGSEQANQTLSQNRAMSVVEYLVSKGINPKRLVPKGLGESNPVKVGKKLVEKYPFLKEGDVLDENFINNLSNSQDKEICHQINRRTEFAVISTDFKEDINAEEFGSDDE